MGILFYYVFRVSGPWGSLWSFLLILILGTIAFTAWITPFGPVFMEVEWVPIAAVILFFALLLAAASPSSGRQRRREVRVDSDPDPAAGTVAAVGIFFFILVFLMAAIALVGILID